MRGVHSFARRAETRRTHGAAVQKGFAQSFGQAHIAQPARGAFENLEKVENEKYEKQKIDRVITEDEVREQINHLKDYFYNPKNLIRTKYVLSQYIDRIDISNENVQVQFKVSMSPSDNAEV